MIKFLKILLLIFSLFYNRTTLFSKESTKCSDFEDSYNKIPNLDLPLSTNDLLKKYNSDNLNYELNQGEFVNEFGVPICKLVLINML